MTSQTLIKRQQSKARIKALQLMTQGEFDTSLLAGLVISGSMPANIELVAGLLKHAGHDDAATLLAREILNGCLEIAYKRAGNKTRNNKKWLKNSKG